jgi:hypothetical protein
MSFGWLGTFRQGSWQAYRRFVLEERKDIVDRMAVIEAELTRIGTVTVYYNTNTDAEGKTEVTEQRQGISVTPGSSLGKLFQAYVALGGNPFDISLFLTPDAVVLTDPLDEEMKGADVQPYQGVVYPQSASYTTGGIYQAGFMSLRKYVPARVGGRRELEDYAMASNVDKSRRWIQKEIRYKRNDIEARIVKLCDLREQLLQELEDIAWSTAGITSAIPLLDENLFDKDLTVANLVATIDSIFYLTSEDGVADFTVENTTELGYHPYLLSDISPDEDNTAL